MLKIGFGVGISKAVYNRSTGHRCEGLSMPTDVALSIHLYMKAGV